MRTNPFHPFLSFLKLKQDFPGAFFFESARLSVIGLDVDESIRLVGGKVEVGRLGVVHTSEEDFLDYLNKKASELSSIPSTFPYSNGGIFGCLGYEVISLIEKRLTRSGYFKQISHGSEPLAEVFISHNLIVFFKDTGKVFMALRDYPLNEDDLVRGADSVGRLPTEEVNLSRFHAHSGFDQFLSGVAEIKEHIKQGNIFQAVLSDRFERETAISGLRYFSAMKRFCPSAYNFYFDLQESSFFGTSPEALLSIHANQLETHPIAGTKPRGKNDVEDKRHQADLVESLKEGAEHLMLVDLARNDIGRIAEPGTVKVDKYRSLLMLPNVMHLVSVVTGKKREDCSELRALAACFPAGTLSGAPKVRAMEILSEIETRPRGFYGGAVIALDFAGGLESCIAIRSVELKNQTAILRAGAGIVADSDPESEYAEIKHKLKSLMQILEVAEQELS